MEMRKVKSFNGGDISLRAWRMGQALLKTASKPPENGCQCPRTQSYSSKLHASEISLASWASGQEDNLLKSTIFSVNLQPSPRRYLCDIYDA